MAEILAIMAKNGRGPRVVPIAGPSTLCCNMWVDEASKAHAIIDLD